MLMKKNWPFILFFLTLVGLFTLLIVFRSFFIENILRPIGLVFWLVWRVITSVHQSFYWAMVILISAFLVIRMLPKESMAGQNEQTDDSKKVTNPYFDWLSSFTHSTSNRSAFENLRQRLRELTTSFVCTTDGLSISEAETILQSRASPLSKESQAFLFSDNEIYRTFVGKLNLRMTFFLTSLRKGKITRIPKIIHQPVDEILSYMEEKAKTHHGH
jgi:hypothetical protein